MALATKVGAVLVLASPGLLQPTMAAAQSLLAPVWVPGQAAPYHLTVSDPAERASAVRCLAEAVYYEAGFEPLEGQRAVAQVVLNRVRDPNFPQSICGVVYQGWTRTTGCQFSFVCDGSLDRRPPTPEQLEDATLIADQALSGYVVTEVGAATHYHTDYVDPYWRSTLVEITKIGQHIFYRWPGKAGQPEALTAAYAGGEEEMWEEANEKRIRRALRS